ncbi:30S ribosomal protein S12 methylthiotransferase RimO [Desulforamulus ferrireducens]|uniref:Ribosomal protein uS12 methylthiotransferase RimO n=1 Tax=Desulforamulus ferrireducens TaxID=1833852 RepID=A0A1S6IWZ8_9FIRM|nr:30S ribosomal protein S12 methylthiotransferase RimO [Desulforamulus ferrireducens]AQS59307.1 ribosomal protein S12 methylthiotransferase RimO [Desulforamulus ferrireducens]
MATVGLISLGCPKNLVDSEVMLGLLRDAQHHITNQATEADVLIVNTCGFIESAKEESIRHIFELAQHKETGKCQALIVTGCLAQRYHRELMEEIPEIDALVGPGQITGIVDVIEDCLSQGERKAHINEPLYLYDEHSPRLLSTPPYTAYVKIAEGCDNRCAYCAIPDIRGNFRSRTLESVEAEVRKLVGQGVKEIILIAQDTTRYGQDLYGEYRLAELIKRISPIAGLEWIRLLYCYPNRFTQELIDVIAQTPNVCKYIDLPLQHASDDILKAMKRPVNQQQARELIGTLRSKIPGIVIRTSFIVGFPGETEQQFLELLKFMEEVQFDRAGVFTYSQEEGTPAATMDNQLAEEIKQERYHRAMQLQKEISLKRNQQRIGERVEVLVEEVIDAAKMVYAGRSAYDAPEIDGTVEFTSPRTLQPGDLVIVKINRALEYDLMGELAQ